MLVLSDAGQRSGSYVLCHGPRAVNYAALLLALHDASFVPPRRVPVRPTARRVQAGTVC